MKCKSVSGVCKFVGSPLFRRVESVVRMMTGQKPLDYVLFYLKSNGCAIFSTMIVCSLSDSDGNFDSLKRFVHFQFVH